ncbi:MAG: type II toxin-antitoxin system Phd/YefM family antitoxin [Spirochaetia bacterium]|jgi:prevent-host-death family protein
MRTVNALEIRNHLGVLLDELERTGEPVIVSKGRKPRAVLISVEDFRKRFVDRQTEERRQALMDRVLAARAERVGGADSLSILRALRGALGEVRH